MASATNLGNLFVTLNAHTLQYQRAMDKANRTTDVTMRNINKAIKFGVAAGVASFGILAAASVRAFSQFESSFAGVEKTVDASRAELDKLAVSFRQMAKEIPINVNEINRVGEAAGQLGIATENIEGFTKTMLELGIATNLTAEEAATSLARLANITGLPQTSFDRLGSTIVELGNNFATTEAEIVNMTLRLSGAAKIVGFTEAEMLGLATAMSSVGIRAEEGGTAFSKILLEMNSSVKGMTKELDIFARIAGTSVDEFAELFEKDALTAVLKFIEGLDKINASGGDVAGQLGEVGLQGIRVTSSLLKLASAGDLVSRSVSTANAAWEENSALTNEVQKRYETFESKVTLLGNALNDILITIGASLVPVLKDLLEVTGQNEEAAAEFNAEVEKIATGMANILRVSIALVRDFSKGWTLISNTIKIVGINVTEFIVLMVKGLQVLEATGKAKLQSLLDSAQMMFGGLKLFGLNVLQFINNTVNSAIAPMIAALNLVITKLNEFTGTSFEPIELKLNTFDFTEQIAKIEKEISDIGGASSEAETKLARLSGEFKALSEAAASEEEAKLAKELQNVFEGGSSVVNVFKDMFKEEEKVIDATVKLSEEERRAIELQTEWGAAIDKSNAAFENELLVMTDVIKITKAMREEADLLKESIKTPFDKGIESLARYDELLKAGLITQQQFNTASAQAFGTTTGELGLPEDGMEGAGGAGGFSTGAFGGGMLGGFAMGGEGGDELAKLQMEEQQLQAHMERMKEIRLAGQEEISKEQLAVLDALHQQTGDKLAENIVAQNELIFGSIQETSDQMLGFLKKTAGEQSGIYKAMFAVSKAFAIADSIVKIQQGIANAFSLPFPANIAAAISVASQAAGIVSTIQSTVANFEGGGLTPSGSRSGGVDGRGGFMAVLHPDEKITDLRKEKTRGGSSGGGGVELVVNINNMMGEAATVTAEKSDDGTRLDVLIKRTEKEIASNIRTGRGDVGEAIGATFNIRRGLQ